MSVRASLVLLVLLPLAARAAGDATTVRISLSVLDRQGQPVSDLTIKDFELREDGVVQKITGVERRRPEPRRLAIVLDEFHVAPERSEAVKSAVAAFVDGMLRADDALVVLKPLDPLTSIHLGTDRSAADRVVASFQGRKGNYEPRTALEAETMGRAPSLVESGRSQVILSALRALTGRLGSSAGRSAILLVTEGFAPPAQASAPRGLPDLSIVERFANRYDVPVYAIDPRSAESGDGDAAAVPVLNRLVTETGGALLRDADVAAALACASRDIDSGYTLAFQPAHGDDGKYHPVQVRVVRRAQAQAQVRARAGYVAAPSEEARIAAMRGSPDAALASARIMHRSPFIDVWSGVTRVSGTQARVAVAWEPQQRVAVHGTYVRSTAARVVLKATSRVGTLLFEGALAPVRPGGADAAGVPDRAEFEAPPGRVQLDMTVLGIGGEKLDVDIRDVDVPALSGAAPVLLPPVVVGTRSARQFREVASDDNATPDPSREFSRTERLVIRVPAYAGSEPLAVKARLLNRLGQPMRDIDALPAGASGVPQFDLPLAPLAPGDYFLLFSATGNGKAVEQRISFRVTG